MKRIRIRQCLPPAACASLLALAPLAVADSVAGEAGTPPSVRAESPADAGRYLVVVGGCNDCHTANWAETHGTLPEQEWLTGLPIGWRGPWGTTYASNLRLVAHELTEDAWVALLRHRVDRPPMPWANVNRMSEADARALYRFIRSLGPAGEIMPAAVGPDEEPSTPWFSLDPVSPPDS